MELTLAPNPLHTESQILNFDKVATLIGGNGSGKSCILQAIFETKLAREDFDDLRVVCFSSGQNENFSKQFSQYLTKERKAGKSLNLECFYYDKSWSKLLIFLATCLHSNGKVREFLRDNGYVEEEEVSSVELDDASSQLVIKFKIDKQYAVRVQAALKEEEVGVLETLRATPFFRSLSSFIEENVDADYEFEGPLRKKSVALYSESLLDTSFMVERPDQEEDGDLPTVQLENNPVISFFTQAADNSYFIERTNMNLLLKGDLELDKLSDGEYQLLFLFALIDLFDDKNTLFLLDEADSHLHYQNIEHLWDILGKLEGHAITTTHLLDSITANDFHALKVVEKGCICEENKLKQLIDRLKVLSRATSVKFELCAKIGHLAILDDYNDWEIFIRLAKRKGKDISKLSSIYAIKESSGLSSLSQAIGDKKIDWVGSLSNVNSDLCSSHIFLICDRDELPLADIDNQTGVLVNSLEQKKRITAIKWPKDLAPKVFLLAWKRREIKNYLLSFTALNHHGVLNEINKDTLAVASHLQLNDSGDNEDIRKLSVKSTVNPFINREDVGLCIEMLQNYIDLIPPEEISEDIENMYNFIVSKI